MDIRLDPATIDSIKEIYGLSSFEKVAHLLGRTALTVRKWYHGQTVPAVEDLIKIQSLIGRPYGTMIIVEAS